MVSRMIDYEVVLDDCVEYLSKNIFLQVPTSAISVPVNESLLGPKELLNGEWVALSEIDDMQVRKDMELSAFRRLVLEVTRFSEGEDETHNDLNKLAVILDCVHAIQCSSKHRGDASWAGTWANLYFDLTKIVMQFLQFPSSFLSFFPYFESRLQWYLQGQEMEQFSYGDNKLTSGIKLPLSRLLYYCNELIRHLEAQSKLNTPLHYVIINKIQWFISQLLPISENCNYNKKGQILSQFPETLWSNKHSRGLSSRSPSLFADWNYFLEEFIFDPMNIMLSPVRDRQGFEEYTNDIVEFLLEKESEYYKRLSEVIQQPNLIRQDIHKNFIASQFVRNNYIEPQDTRNMISETKVEFWKVFVHNDESMNGIMHPLPLELSIFDEQNFLNQLETVELDFFRKNMLMQIAISFNMVDTILRDKATLKAYTARYKNAHYDRIFPPDPPTLFKFFYSTANKIKEFYKQKDYEFYEILIELLHSDESFLAAKSKNMAPFKEIKWNCKPIDGKPSFDYEFKKFGFIKLGNKKVNDIWKIESGLDRARILSKANEINPSAVYNKLQEEFQNSNVKNSQNSGTDGSILKQWQLLRSLRSQYLFEFNTIDETTGIAGLFDPNLAKNSKENKAKNTNSYFEKELNNHRELLEQAQKYFEKETIKAVKSEEDSNSRKRRLDDDDISEEDSDSRPGSKKVKTDLIVKNIDLTEPENTNVPSDLTNEKSSTEIEAKAEDDQLVNPKSESRGTGNELEHEEDDEAVPEC
ncbi:Hpr1p Ecym_4240 [Eremothecium cymbalariae DBVPG|uniref:Uncharacterized protein n=1 Tax=Eremothecium cymbalariae (strain CBS 270.75 / DBVPG 7215 / KCTC 17166 / NRRL Y-17582) TaxID=931890 RepID=G8JTF3_ERECY|nr:hypothetical protein Ecym_4240 [Eremothecium cymbalariae DBVPG\